VLGQQLFAMQPELGYGVIMAMFVTYMIMIVTILPLARYMSHVTMVSTVYMAPIVISFTLVGSFVPREYLFDMYLALVFGAIGYIARRTGYHVAAILIGVILGPLLEQYFLRALRIAEGNILVIFSSTIGNVLWVLLLISVFSPYVVDYIRRNRQRAADREAEFQADGES
jgi:putative tricarboxylic transport membrane protein